MAGPCLLQSVQGVEGHHRLQQRAQRGRHAAAAHAAGRAQRAAARGQHLALGVGRRRVLHQVALLPHPHLEDLGRRERHGSERVSEPARGGRPVGGASVPTGCRVAGGMS